MDPADPIAVADAPERGRYEATAGAEPAGTLEYRDRPGRRLLIHTEVPAAFAGRGVGGAMARAALDDLRARGVEVVPMCPFVAAWIARHPGYRDLVPPSALRLLPAPPPG